MRDWALRWVTSALALAIIAHIPVMDINYNSVTALLLATVWIGLVNSLVRPVLMVLSSPLNCLTFGLSSFCLNALLFYTTQWAVKGFTIGFWGAFLGPILMGLIGGLLNTFIGAKKK
jgi:putative membrane protein